MPWRRAGRPDLVEFAATTTRKRRGRRRGPCTVDGCQRPRESAETSLCHAHHFQHRYLGLPIEQFRINARVHPHPPPGHCSVVACDRDRFADGPYCRLHYRRRAAARKADPEFDEDRWRRVAPPIAEDNHVCLLGLPNPVALELLYGLQARTDDGFRTDFSTLRRLADRARAAEVGTLRELPDAGLTFNWTRPLHNHIVEALERLDRDPLTSWNSDHWSLRSVGHTGTLHFDSIHQPWLREATKRWVFEQLPKRRGHRVANLIKTHIGDIARFSASLARHRADRGGDPGALSRNDVTEFLNWLSHKQGAGTISSATRQRICGHVYKMLRGMRSMGLTRPGQSLADLPDDVALERCDVPTALRDGSGRDLPKDVVAALITQLPAASVDARCVDASGAGQCQGCGATQSTGRSSTGFVITSGDHVPVEAPRPEPFTEPPLRHTSAPAPSWPAAFP